LKHSRDTKIIILDSKPTKREDFTDEFRTLDESEEQTLMHILAN